MSAQKTLAMHTADKIDQKRYPSSCLYWNWQNTDKLERYLLSEQKRN